MTQLADVLIDIAQHAYRFADITGFDLLPGHPPMDEEMNKRRDAVREVSSEITALADQARGRQVHISEVQALMARLGKLGFYPTGDQSLGLVDAMKEAQQ